jgi:hypothetical protein
VERPVAVRAGLRQSGIRAGTCLCISGKGGKRDTLIHTTCVRVVSELESVGGSLIVQVRVEADFIMPPRRERQSPDREDRDAEEGVGQQVTQRWSDRCEISGRDSKKWRLHRGVELVQ